MNEIHTTYYSSPIGLLRVCGTENYITEVHFLKTHITPEFQKPLSGDAPGVVHHCVNQLIEYFAGQRNQFDVPVHQEGSDFQQRVWSELLTIPYGKTISYLQLSKQLGNPKAIRAAASTNGKNKIGILVPCHRVIGSNNTLVGFAGGLPVKKWLLQHEAKYTYGVQTLF
jgi:methylated-DNA-[protein]-cysteine S-methyltransferase